MRPSGGSGSWRDNDPINYSHDGPDPMGRWPLVVIVLLMVIPLVVGAVLARLRRSA